MTSPSATALVAADRLERSTRLPPTDPLRKAGVTLGDICERHRCISRARFGVLYLEKVERENSDFAAEEEPLRAMLNMGWQLEEMKLAGRLEVKVITK